MGGNCHVEKDTPVGCTGLTLSLTLPLTVSLTLALSLTLTLTLTSPNPHPYLDTQMTELLVKHSPEPLP